MSPPSLRVDHRLRGFISLLASLIALASPACRKVEAPVAPPPPTVVLATVTPTNAVLHVEFIGRLDSPRNIEVRARVEGFVDQILFAPGTDVAAGDPLFRLDQRPFQEALAAAEGALAEAKASLSKNERDVARLEPLAQKRAIPQQDLENARASVEVARAALASAQARVASANLDLSYCEILAPGPGRIGVQQVAVGDLVGKGQPTLLATISQLDPLWFQCAISEVEYLRAERQIRENHRELGDLPATLILPDGTEHPEPGRWIFLDRAVDAATGTLRARAEFSNPGKILRPGMFARVRVQLRNAQSSLVIPQRAVLEIQGQNFVWRVGPDQVATQQPVRTGPRVGSGWIIEDGLKPGDRIVVEGVQKVRQGAPVTPVPPPSPSPGAPSTADSPTRSGARPVVAIALP